MYITSIPRLRSRVPKSAHGVPMFISLAHVDVFALFKRCISHRFPDCDQECPRVPTECPCSFPWPMSMCLRCSNDVYHIDSQTAIKSAQECPRSAHVHFPGPCRCVCAVQTMYITSIPRLRSRVPKSAHG